MSRCVGATKTKFFFFSSIERREISVGFPSSKITDLINVSRPWIYRHETKENSNEKNLRLRRFFYFLSEKISFRLNEN